MPSECVFEFDRPEPVYYSGETINGRIVLTTSNEKSVKEVYILFHGEAKVRWEESRTRTENGRSQTYTEYYTAQETYLNTRKKVAGHGKLPAGKTTYTFFIPLPLQCPTSCVEQYGQIRYELSLVLNRPYRFDNVFKQPLTVLKKYDLNLNRDLLLPLTQEDVKYFCWWPCSSGPVISTLNIPFGGYAPGQDIKYSLQMDNQSHGYDLEGITLKLIQTYTFTAQSPHYETRNISNTLAKTVEAVKCLRLSKRIVKGSLLIPPVPPTSSNDGGIITVRYHILMSINTGKCHTDSEIQIPITIGTVPLAQSATNRDNFRRLEPTAPDMPQTPDSPTGGNPPNYSNFKPPSYKEATNISGQFIDTDVDKHNRAEGFIPKYPMFTNFAIPSAPPPSNDVADEPLLDLNESNGAQSQLPYPTDNINIMPQAPSNDFGWKP